MATATASQDVVDRFEMEVTLIQNKIETQFSELSKALTTRKNKLLKDLQEILYSYKRERTEQKQKLLEIEKGLNSIKENFQSLTLKEFQSGIMKNLEEKQKKVENELKEKHISIKFDITLLEMINVFGKISVDTCNVSSLPVVQYTGKVRPVVSVGTKGGGRGEFSNPWGVVVEQRSGNIYVADQSNNRVEVFNGEARYLSEFGSDKMKSPLCIAI